MKRCPECGRDYNDDSMSFCLDDGSELLFGPASGSEPPAVAGGQFDEPQTAILHSTAAPGEAPTRAHIHTTEQTAILSTGPGAEPRESLDGLPEKHSFSAHRAAKPLAGLVVAVVVFVGGFIGYRYLSSPDSGAINSIAVLPFQNRSGDPNSEYLSDGLAESLIYRLSQLPDLKVSPTSSVIQYKGKDTKVATIASELGVDAVMTGRLAQIGDNLTISVELVDVRNNKLLWGEQYERKMSELLATQREIATTITRKLQLKLSGEETGLTKKYTNNNEAYQLYLKGRFSWNKRSAESLKQAVEFYNQAIEKDPGFALAYAGLAETYAISQNYVAGTPKETMPKTKAAALRALELDDSLAEAHAALGRYFNDYEFDFAGGEKELRRAIELNPKYAIGHLWLGNILMFQKRFDEALVEFKLARDADPLSLIASAEIANGLTAARRYDEAISQASETLKLDPNFFTARYYLGRAYLYKGMPEEAIAEFRKATAPGDRRRVMGLLASALIRSGKRAEAMEIFDQVKAEAATGDVRPYAMAQIYAALGNKEEALVWMERTVAERWQNAFSFAYIPDFDELRSDPRFKAILKRANLPE
jgi:TolB-like protein